MYLNRHVCQLMFNPLQSEMAASALLRRATVSPNIFTKLFNPLRSASVSPSVSRIRGFNTNTEVTRYDDDDRAVDVDRRGSDISVSRRRDPSIFSDVFDPFSPTRSLSQVLNLMDQLMENPFVSASGGIGSGRRRGWDVKEDTEALYLRMDMPGLDKEDVKVWVEHNTLIIKGERAAAADGEEEEESGRRYSSRLDLPSNGYKIEEIKAEMKNGVLKVKIPKAKEEERKDVVQVNVE